jgi:predicted Zn-dependent protease
LCLALALSPSAWSQVKLPSLGESASDEVTVSAEKRIGEQIMREVGDPTTRRSRAAGVPAVDLAATGGRCTPARRHAPDIDAASPSSRSWCAIEASTRSRCAALSAHLALINLTSTADELASVLAHELTHITQRHIARSVTTNQRQSMLALAGLILGVLAASKGGSPDAAQAAILGGQAAAVQGQLNFSRDMEREADRVGFAVLREAGFAPAGMARMFEKLDYANRLNDNGAYPYLRSHPLTTERVAEAQSRLGTGAVAAGKVRPEHALKQARARVLMDPTVQARRRQQDLDKALANSAEDRLAALYASVLASLLLRDFARAGEAFVGGERLVASGAIDARSARQWALLGVELAVAQGDAAVADKRRHRCRWMPGGHACAGGAGGVDAERRRTPEAAVRNAAKLDQRPSWGRTGLERIVVVRRSPGPATARGARTGRISRRGGRLERCDRSPARRAAPRALGCNARLHRVVGDRFAATRSRSPAPPAARRASRQGPAARTVPIALGLRVSRLPA